MSRKVNSSELVAIIVKCGACEKEVKTENAYFEVDDNSCPGCDGSGGQYTCLCGGRNKTIEFTCPECKYYGSIDVY
jgi:hypothetical protein